MQLPTSCGAGRCIKSGTVSASTNPAATYSLCPNQAIVESHGFLNAMVACNFMVVIVAAAKTYPFLYPLALVFAPWKVIRSLPRVLNEAKVQVRRRIKMRHDLKHSDYFEQLLPASKPSPTDDKQISHMLTVAGQLLIGGYYPTSAALYMGFYFLLKNPIALEQVRHEVREKFQRYEDIEAEPLKTLPFLSACLQETLRLSAVATHHSLPRISPGATVDQEHIPKGVSIPLAIPGPPPPSLTRTKLIPRFLGRLPHFAFCIQPQHPFLP